MRIQLIQSGPIQPPEVTSRCSGRTVVVFACMTMCHVTSHVTGKMADWSVSRFLEGSQEELPGFCVYDRTATADDDDPKLAVLYPSMQGDDEATIGRQVILLGQFIGFVEKLDQELANSYPRLCHLQHAVYAFKHVGKYTLLLRGTYSFPDHSILAELETIYSLFCFFYGGFQTWDRNTKQLKEMNPDVDLCKHFKAIFEILSSPDNLPLDSHRILAPGVPITSHLVVNHKLKTLPRFKQLTREIALLLHSQCAAETVLGALAMYDGEIITHRNLTQALINCISVAINKQSTSLGYELDSGVNNSTFIKCYIKPNLLEDKSHCCLKQQNNVEVGCLIHLKGPLSLTLLVCRQHHLTERDFIKSWRKPCTRLRDELLRLFHSIPAEPKMARIASLPRPQYHEYEYIQVGQHAGSLTATFPHTINSYGNNFYLRKMVPMDFTNL